MRTLHEGVSEKFANRSPMHTAPSMAPKHTGARQAHTELERAASPTPRASPNRLTAQSCIFLGYLINLLEL